MSDLFTSLSQRVFPSDQNLKPFIPPQFGMAKDRPTEKEMDSDDQFTSPPQTRGNTIISPQPESRLLVRSGHLSKPQSENIEPSRQPFPKPGKLAPISAALESELATQSGKKYRATDHAPTPLGNPATSKHNLTVDSELIQKPPMSKPELSQPLKPRSQVDQPQVGLRLKPIPKQGPSSRWPEMQNETAPTIRVTIGRIEVKAVTAPPLPIPKKQRPSPRLSLEAYLKQRSGN